MDIIIKIAEERIKEAIERGEFDDLPNKGKPLRFEDDSWVPEDQRLAYKILKNAGCVPPELEMKKEIRNLMDFLKAEDDEKERIRKLKELNFKLMKFNMAVKRPLNLDNFPDYEARVIEKLSKE